MKILVSGATGWMGQSFWREINQGSFPFSSKDLVGLTSNTNKKFYDSENMSNDYWSLRSNSTTDGFVHLAFLTRDKVSLMPIEDYVATNIRIINQAVKIIEINRPKWVALVSSGAVYSKESGFTELEVSLEKNPYGFLKLEEERLLKEITAEIGANLAIGRLWGATGRDLPPNPKYAVSDFISSALTSRTIKINSQHKVYRRYCDASEFMNVLVSSAMKHTYSLFNSGGTIVELADLASEIASQIGGCEISRNLQPQASPDCYYPKDNSYENLALSHGISILNLKDQISKTILGHTDRN